ncbi:hypothetical protein BH24ACT3_BH24ACT3_14650 [soil metagenome]
MSDPEGALVEEIDRAGADACARVERAESLAALDAVDREALGKKSGLAGFKRRLGGLEVDERRTVGQALNRVTAEVQAAMAERRSSLTDEARREQLAAERLDLTEVPHRRHAGHLHLVTQAI